jgi:hypothetical protein
MSVWTIAAQEGTGGERIAADLAAAAGVPLLDRPALARIAHELDPDELEVEDLEEIERRFGGRLRMLALGMAYTAGPAAPAAFEELRFRNALPALGRAVIGEVTRRPCVILAPAAFAALPAQSGAINVRLRAPLACRIDAYQRDHLVDHGCAEKAVKHDDHIASAWVRSLYHLDINDDRLFTLVLDATRFSADRLVEILLAAGGERRA